ncbi:MAG TPA: amidohydrolase family protein [Alphaproteobacteria bacterium]|jgi:predicted TIM-barrel fold metal-dependent hydrolase
MRYEYISADNHLDTRWLPADLWQARLPSKMKAQGPRVVETPEGSQWEWEGKVRGPAAAGSSNEKMQKQYFPNIDLKPGDLPSSTPSIVLHHMDMASIYAGVFYGDTRKWAIQDAELKLEVYRAYNDHAMEMNAVNPDRIVVLPNLPTAFPDKCEAELDRLIKKGAKAVEFGVFDVGAPIYDTVWEPIWTKAEEAGVAICCHIGDKAGTPYPENRRGSLLAHFSIVPMVLAPHIAQFIFGGIVERHPKLNVSFAECRVGWVPFLISWMDRQVHERKPDPDVKLTMLPSEYIKRNVTFTFEEDAVGVELVKTDWGYIKDSAIWGADYPHEQGTWPNPKPVIDKMFAGADEKLKRAVLFDRAARIFSIEGGRS